jgi:hypothetical protein
MQSALYSMKPEEVDIVPAAYPFLELSTAIRKCKHELGLKRSSTTAHDKFAS